MIQICERVGIGPNCTKNYLEHAPATQTDCISEALMRCAANVAGRMAFGFAARRHLLILPNKDIATDGCLYQYDHYNTECWYLIRDCYCTGSGGQVCVSCDTTPPVTGGISSGGPDPIVTPPPVEIISKTYQIPLTNSAYGEIIPIIYGSVTVGGNIFWVSNPREEQLLVRDPLASATTTTANPSFVDIELGLCAGEATTISRMWFDDTLVLDLTGASETPLLKTYADQGMAVTFYPGSETQKVHIDDDLTFGKVPAYRGLAYAVIHNFPILVAGGKIPTIRVEVVGSVTNSLSSFETSSLGYSLDSQRVRVDSVSGRVFVAHEDEVKIVAAHGLVGVGALTSPDPIDLNSICVTSDEANIVYQDDAHELTYVAGADHADTAGVSFTSGLSNVVGMNISSDTKPDTTVLFGAYGSTIRQYERDETLRTFEFVREIADASIVSYNTAIFDSFQSPADIYPSKYVYFFADAINGVVKVRSALVEAADAGIFYNPTQSFAITNLDLKKYTNDTTPVLDSVIHDNDAGNFILFITGNALKRVVAVRYYDLSTVWSKEIPSTPLNVGSPARRKSGGRSYSYIAQDGNVYRLNMDTGAVTMRGSLEDGFGAPAYLSGQYYDGVNGFILYVDTDGNLTKLFPDREIPDEPNLTAVFADIFQRALLDPADYNTSNLDQIFLHGYLISEQITAQAAVEELCTFFNLTLSDAGGRVLVNTLSNGAEFAVDDDPMIINSDRKRLITDTNDLYKVTVSYFDINQDGNQYSQSVTRDLFRVDDGTSLNNQKEISYAANIFTDSTTARRSAELYMLQEFERKGAFSLVLGPRALAVEPTDIITYDGHQFRAETVENDITYQVSVSGQSEDQSIYADIPELFGYDVNFGDEDITNNDLSVPTYPYVAPVPAPIDGDTNDRIWFGQVDPDATPVTTFPDMYIKGPTTGAVEVDPVSHVAITGHLTNAPLWTTAQFTLDRNSELVVTFDKDPSAFLSSCTIDELYASYTKNLILVGPEMIQFKDVSVVGNVATMTNLFRGRFGTDQHMRKHILDEKCVLYTPETIQFPAVATDSSRLGVITAIVLNDGSTAGARSTTVRYESERTHMWQPGDIQVFRQTDTFFDIFAVRAFGRASHLTTFSTTDVVGDSDAQFISGSNNQLICAFMRDGFDPTTWDAEEFKSKYNAASGNPFPDAPYMMLLTEIGFNGADLGALAEAGITFPNDRVIVVFKTDNAANLVSEPVAYFFDQKVDYTPPDTETFLRGISGIRLYGSNGT